MTPKKINIAEFRQLGYLQELNRIFLHPLGLALEVTINNETGEEVISGVWDYRDDLEGIQYDLKNSSSERINSFFDKAQFVSGEFDSRIIGRIEKLGFLVEPIPNTNV